MTLEKLKENAFKSSLILFSIGIIGYFFKFIFNSFLARHLSPELYGDFSVAMRVFKIASAYMLFGTAASSKRFFSNYLKKKQHDIASKYLSWNLRIVLISAFFFLLLLALFTIVILGLHIFHIHDIREYHLLVYFLWLSPIGALSLLLASYLICDRDVFLGSFFGSGSFYFFGFLLLIPVIFLLNIKLHDESLWILILCIFILMAAFEGAVLFSRMRNLFTVSIANIFNRSHSDKQNEKEWWRVSSRLILNQIAFSVVKALDIILLEIIDSSEKIVGYYAAALTISGVIWVTQRSLFQFVSPRISTLLDEKGGKQKLQALINKSELTNLILSGALITLIIIFSDPILRFFGPQFIVAKIPLWILLGTAFIAVIGAPAPKLLAYSGHEMCLVYVSILEIVTMMISGVILIYAFSAIGAALATFTTLFLRTILMIYFVRKKLNMKVAILF